MNRAFPLAEVEPSEEDLHRLAGVPLPDEEDRHVLAAALNAEATVPGTSNTRDFPVDAVESLGIEVLTPDQPLSRLVTEYEPQILTAHRTAVTLHKGATDGSTVNALRRAGAPTTADPIARLIGLV